MDEVPGNTKTDNQETFQSMSGRREPGTSGRSWSRMWAVGLQLLGAVLVATAVVVGVFVSHAGATDLSNGTVAIETSSGTVETSPLSMHQLVTVKVGPNSTLSRSSLETAGFPSGAVPIKIIECADPGGLTANLPLSEKQCEPETIDPNGTALENGSMVEPGYTVYSLPDTAELGNSSGTVCDMQHQCVLGIFSNQLDFTKPHLFSAPFFVNPTSTSGGSTGGASPPPPPHRRRSRALRLPPRARRLQFLCPRRSWRTPGVRVCGPGSSGLARSCSWPEPFFVASGARRQRVDVDHTTVGAPRADVDGAAPVVGLGVFGDAPGCVLGSLHRCRQRSRRSDAREF